MLRKSRSTLWLLIGVLLLGVTCPAGMTDTSGAGLDAIITASAFWPFSTQIVHADEPTAQNADTEPDASAIDGRSTTSLPGWLEPRGLSIVELVGEVPEEILQGMIISYGDALGIVVYEEGTRSGNTVVLTTTIYPRLYEVFWAPNNLLTSFNCLGQKPYYDHVGSVVPASTLRLWDRYGNEVTSEVDFMYITALGTEQPFANSSAYFRYSEDSYGRLKDFPLPLGPEGLAIPSNGGCRIDLTGVDYYPLTGVFTYTLDLPVSASVVATQQATFQTYIGVGSMGVFAPLMSQLRSAYGDRHARIPLSIPEDANYFLLKFPPMAGDPHADALRPTRHNVDRITGGTYRLSSNRLSTDLIYSAAFPMDPGWRDADQAPGAEFLPLLAHPSDLAPLEYILPSEIEYDSCFIQGNCPSAILDQIHSAVMNLEIHYLSVGRTGGGGEWTSLQMAGPGWSPAGSGDSAPSGNPHTPAINAATDEQQRAQAAAMTYRVHLPFMTTAIIDEHPPTNCPCGWFDSSGRMLYYCPGP